MSKGSITKSTLIMIFGYLLLGWVPIVGPLTVGIWSGLVAKKVWKAFLAWLIMIMISALITALLVGSIFALLSSIPILAAVLSAGPILVWIMFMVSTILILIGAIIGAIITK